MKTTVLFIVSFFVCNQAFSAELFSWDVEDASTGTFFNGHADNPFDDINNYDGVESYISTDYANSGTKAIKVGYPNDEAGVTYSLDFTATTTLYTRKYEYFDSNWSGNWPIGLKTSRYYTAGTTYHSEKLIWQTYDADCTELYGYGLNSAVLNLDLEDTYGADELFGNGLPYIRTGHWYKFETWMEMNSSDGATDGVLQIWIDDVLVYSNESLAWESTARGATGGLAGWTSMWFGGNYSGAICGNPSTTLYRYIDDLYVSTTLDREDTPSPATGSTATFNATIR